MKKPQKSTTLRALQAGLLASSLLAALALPASAARLAYEGFVYPDANGTVLSSLAAPGATGTGWDGNYGSSLTGPTTSVNLQAGLSYTGFTSAPSSKAMRFGSSNTLYRPWSGTYATPDTITNGTYWYSFLYRPTLNSRGGTLCPFGKPTDPQNGFGMRMDRGSDLTPALPATDIRFQSWGNNGGGGTQTFVGGYDKNYFILGKAVFNSTGNSTNTIWIYQEPAVLPTVEPTTGGLTHTIAFNAVYNTELGTNAFRTALTGRCFSTGGIIIDYDEVRIGDTFAEVFPSSGTPEFTLSPLTAAENHTLTFNWSNLPSGSNPTLNGNAVTIDGSGNGGTTLPAPATNTTYTLAWTGAGSPLTQNFTVIAPSFNITPTSGYLGDNVTLNWQVPVGSTDVTLTPGAVDLTGLTSGVNGVGTTSIPAPSATTEYTLSYTFASVVYTINKTFTLLPSFLNVTPDKAIQNSGNLTINWRIDPAFSTDSVNTSVFLDVGPSGGPYTEIDVTTNTNSTTGVGTYARTAATGDTEYRIRFHVGGVEQTLTDTIALYPKVFNLGTPVNNVKPVVTAVEAMFDGVLAYSDRGHVWANVPSILQGGQFAKLGNDEKKTATLQVPFTAVADGTFFLLLDNRVGDDNAANPPTLGTVMNWVLTSGFVDSGVDVGLDEGANGTVDQFYSVYFRQVSSGESFTFLEQNNGDFRNMYGIVAVSPQVTPVAFAASPKTIISGGSSLLQWTVPTGFDSVTIEPGAINVTSNTNTGTGVGSLTVNPTSTTAYTLTYDPTGAAPPVSLAPVTVNVDILTATPTTINAGASSTLNWTVPATATDVQITNVTGPLTAGSGSVVVTPATSTGYALSYLAAPGDTIRVTPGSVWVSVNPPPGFGGWIIGNFGGNTVPVDQRGPNDDPDNDGIDNLVEYAILGGDPTRSTGSPAVISGTLVTFNKNTTATGITYALEKSSTLASWDPATATTNDANVITYTLAPPTPTKEFIRLNVTQN